jgi:hypothetical protein
MYTLYILNYIQCLICNSIILNNRQTGHLNFNFNKTNEIFFNITKCLIIKKMYYIKPYIYT